MTTTKLILAVFLTVFLYHISEAQLIINEISNKNSSQIADEDGSYEDWIELYNPGKVAINAANYCLSDDSLDMQKWTFPSFEILPAKHLIVFASGKNRTNPPEDYQWESPVLPEHTFDYLVPTSATSANWMKPTFATTGWSKGKAGFGFGDGDDATQVPTSSMAVYIRKTFTIPAGFGYKDVALHVDYDDGFVAYLNGVEIGRKWISDTPTWNSASSSTHEATMYSGGKPEKIDLDTALVRSLLVAGTNTFAIEVHNYIPSSTDMSLIPYFSFKVKASQSYFDATPKSIISIGSTELHTNFKIDGSGEKIYLYNKNSGTTEKIWVNDLSSGWSLGRVTDGAISWGVFIQPTPGSANTTKAYSTEREPEPGFSVPEGFYTTKQTIRLTTTSLSAEIRYTTDGSEPLPTSNLYSGTPISISATKVIRATCFSKNNKLPGRSVSNTYFINNTGHSVPVLSVITDNSNLYGGAGIFDNWQQEWEKPCYVEYFDADKQKKFEQFTGIQIDGGAGGSRSNPQHSFRLEFDNKNYGEGDVDYPLLPDRPGRKDYKSIYLRNGSNQWLTFQFKDAMETKTMSNHTNNYYSACTPVVVYINGSYFGLYEMREKLNDEYFEENYNATIDSTFNLLSLSWYYNSIMRALNGSVENFTNDYNNFLKLNFSDPNYLQKADQILDLDYYTDYIAAQTWIADTDWPYNNIKIVKGDFTNNRWRFILQDLEWALNPNGWTNSGYDHIGYMLNYNPDMPYIRFWQELIKYSTYKYKFINRLADLMNSSYLPENTIGIAQSIYDASYSEMRAEYVKWGGGEAQANNRMTQYQNNMETFKSELTNRSNTVRNNVVSNFNLTGKYNIELQVQPANAGVIQINTISPEEYPWNGVYFAGIPIRMEAKGMGNYVFDGWEPNAIIKNTANPVIAADVKVSGYKFIAKFRLQRPETTVTISEINYNSGEEFPAGDWVELYNYGQSAANLTGWYLTDSENEHQWTIPGQVILEPNQRLVLASNKSKFSSVYPGVSNVLGSFLFGLGSLSDSVRLFDSAGKLIAGIKYSNQSPWPSEAFDQGKTLELKNPDINLNLAANWFAGCTGGSPGTAYQTCGTTSAEGLSELTAARLFPNPAGDLINIVLPSSAVSGRMNCRIYDLLGKLVKTETFDSTFQNRLQLNIADLRDGIYVVQISDGTNRQSLKFIKQRN
jgi:hypothetical protein